MQEKEYMQTGFVQRTAPWLAAGGALLIYLITLNHWVTAASLPTVATVTEWDWWSLKLQAPVFYILTYPIRWLPLAWQPIALNLFSAVCAAGAVGLLARSVALLPHDRTREQRQRERSEFSLLSKPLAWVPPVFAALACGLQLTFWEHATASTGESLNLLFFAYIILCLLEYRLDERESRLCRMAFVYGLAITNNWAMIGFFPAFLIAVVWTKGWSFFRWRFVARMAGLGCAGLLIYLLLPLIEMSRQGPHMPYWELLKMEWGMQKGLLVVFPKYIVLLCGLTSLLPVFVMGVRWPSVFGETSVVGTMLTNIMFRVVHGMFLVACLWVMFDPPFSPRALGLGFPFLPFYYLSAMAIGYFSGYFLLVYGTKPDKKWRHATPAQRLLNRGLVGVVLAAFVAAPVGLAYKNLGHIRANNSPYLGQLADTLAKGLPEHDAIVLSDEPINLFLVEAAFQRSGKQNPHLLLETRSLPYQFYQRSLVKRYPGKWPGFLTGPTVHDPIDYLTLLRVMTALAKTNQIYYLHPSFGYYFESFYAKPNGLVNQLMPYSPEAVTPPEPSQEEINTNLGFWSMSRNIIDALPNPANKPKGSRLASDIGYVARFYSRAADYYGVRLQQAGRLAEAAQQFDLALKFNPDNVAALINRGFNASLQRGQPQPVKLSHEDQLKVQAYRSWEEIQREHGPLDEPQYCMEAGLAFARSRPPLVRQAAHQFLRVQALDPSNINAKILLANMYLQWPMPDTAIEMVNAMRAESQAHPLTHDNRIELICLEALAQAAKTNLAAAETVLMDAQKQYPGEETLPETLSQIYLQSGQFSNALAAIEQQLRIAPKDVKALLNKGAICIQLGKHQDAIPPLTQVLQAEPNNDAARMNRAIANLKGGHLEEAQHDYEELLRLFPDFYRAYYGLAQIADQRGDNGRAINFYELYLNHAPQDANHVLLDQTEAQSVTNRLKELRSGATSR